MAAQFANATNQIAALKELYEGGDYMKDLVYKKNPLLALIPKNEAPAGFAGKYIPVPTVFATPQGRSATFSNAQLQQTAPGLASFFVYRVSNYQLASITNELLEATKEDAGAFVDEAKLVMDTAIRNITNDLAADLYKSGTGSRAQISSAGMTTGATPACSFVVADLSQIAQIENGMLLVASASDGGAVSADTVLVTGVNRSTGVVSGTSSTAASSSLSGNWAASSYVLVSGDQVVSSVMQKVSGLAAWIGTSVFWGVDRSQDSRLSMMDFDFSDRPIEEALIDLAAQINLNGGAPDMAFVNFSTYAAIEKALGSKVQYVDVKHDEVDIAFSAIRLHSAYGPISVVADRNCPAKTVFMLQMDTLCFRSLGKAPHVLTYGLEGLEGLRVGNADALEIRIGYYGNLISNAPIWNGRAKLNA